MKVNQNRRVKRILIIAIFCIAIAVSFIYYKSLAFQVNAKKIEEIEFNHGSDLLSGNLYLPKGEGPFSVVIFLHGDGPANRDGNGMYNIMFNAFLDKGIACFAYDKPNVGKSTGNWLAQTMADRAGEALQARQILRARNDLNKIGYIGFSQGGWVISELALLDPGIDFMVLVSGAIDWLEQKDYLETTRLLNQGLTEEEIRVYQGYSSQIDNLIRAGDYQEYVDYINQLQQTSNLYNKALLERERFFFVHLNLESNATEGIRAISCPFLGIFGEKDQHVNVLKSVAVYSSILQNVGNQNYQICLFKDATHELLKKEYKPITQGGFTGKHIKAFFKGKGIYTDGFLDKLGDWTAELSN